MTPINDSEAALLSHVTRWGADGYPIVKRGRSWWWDEAYGVKGSPTPYKTKAAAVAAFEVWHDLARERFRDQSAAARERGVYLMLTFDGLKECPL